MRQKLITILGTVVILSGILNLVAIYFLRNNSVPKYPISSPTSRLPSSPFTPSNSNAFLPISDTPTKSNPISIFATPQVIQDAVNELKEEVFNPPIIKPELAELLPLPTVPTTELTINNQGASSFGSYIEEISKRSKEIKFPYTKFDSLLKDSKGRPLTVSELIDLAQTEKNFLKIDPSLAILQEFFENKVNFEKTVATQAEGTAANQLMLGLDKLTLNLMAKARGVASQNVAPKDFDEFYSKYKATIPFYGTEFKQKSGIAEKNGTFFTRLAKLFTNSAHAFILGYGGLISYVNYCPCTGVVVYVTGNSTAGAYFMYWPVYYSSLYLYHRVTIGAYILGSYVPGPGYCAYPPYCEGSFVGDGIATVIYGTS